MAEVLLAISDIQFFELKDDDSLEKDLPLSHYFIITEQPCEVYVLCGGVFDITG